MNKLLSICIPTYNRAQFLPALLESIITQINGHEDKVEIIVSDNASTDNTKQITQNDKSAEHFFKNAKKILSGDEATSN